MSDASTDPTDLDAPGASLASVFEAQAARHPERIAVEGADGRLTYRALDEAADRIADLILARLGPGAGTVALLFAPGAAIVVAILGALKAGKIYVALDPSYPAPRTAFMLSDSEARLLLTDPRHLGLAREVAADGQAIALAGGEDTPPVPAAPRPDVSGVTGAFLLYTSGSTGHPKGVLHTHRNVLVEARNYTRDARIGPDDRLSVWHSFSFANSIRNLYGALLNGAAVHPYDLPGQGLIPLAGWIRERGITMIHTLATTFRAFTDVLPPDATFPSVRVLRLGGEAITTDDVDRFRRHFPRPCLLMHVMGPTETFSIRRLFIDHDWRGAPGKVPVGYPVADKDVLLLDEDGRPVEPGVPGEIVIRSKYLAVGYWRQPELTRAVFHPDPEGGAMRRYATGDLGVMTADGCLTHLGRKDFQVKIRGTRVETAEIEVALSRLEGVKASVVHAQPDRRGELRLVAYVIPAPGGPPTIPAMRRQLSETLPEVMVPSSVVFLEEFPVLPNGKIDRRALPRPSSERPRRALVAPRHPLEAQIVTIWRELLDTPAVGIHDDFFELGGHSLLAARLMQRLEAEVGRALPVTTLFSAPTVAGLAEAVQRDGPADNDLLEPIRAEGTAPPLFFFHGDYNGGGFYSRSLARELPPEQPFYAVHPHPLTSRPIPDTVDGMVTELVAAIRAARPRGPYRLGGHCNGGLLAFEVARRLAAEGETVDVVVIIDASARNVRFRPLSRLTRGLARVGGLDARAEAALFLSVRDRAISLAWRFAEWRRRRTRGEPAPTKRERSPVRQGDGEDLDVAAGPRARSESARVTRFREVVRRHVPGRYAGAVFLLVPSERPSPRPDLWWSRVAPRVAVHAIPGAHLTSITEHGPAVAARMRACLGGEEAIPRA